MLAPLDKALMNVGSASGKITVQVAEGLQQVLLCNTVCLHCIRQLRDLEAWSKPAGLSCWLLVPRAEPS
jgi:hypothetical protein